MNNVLAWMAAVGVQLDDHQPDARLLAHFAAKREASEQNRNASSRLTRLATAVGLVPTTRITTDPMTSCCAA